jgi:molecular chaperone GrpE
MFFFRIIWAITGKNKGKPDFSQIKPFIAGQFVFCGTLGKIIDNLTFASICKIMKEKDVKFSGEANHSGKHRASENMGDINTDENMAGTTHLNDEVSEESELEVFREELQAQKDKYLRLFADFDNFRKRTARENLELRQTAGKEVIIALLDVLDDCDRAEKQLQQEDDINQLKEGVQLVFNKLRSVLQGKGLKAMESLHTDFDVEKHEAITEIPAPNDELKGKVLDELQKGYYLNDKIVRFAKVIIGK